MRIFRNFDEAGDIRNPVVTTGSFDGVHAGHRVIINRLKKLAEVYDGESVLITFYPHPRKVLYPDTAGRGLKLINSQEEKMILLEKAGLDNVIVVNFTLEFSKISSEQFVRDLLHRKLHAKVVVAGFNHHFGFNKEGDYRQLWDMRERYNFEAEEIPEQEVEHETVSSTRIRKAVSEGYIQRANAYLDHYYLIMGTPGEYLFYPGENGFRFRMVPVTDEDKLLPPAGVYAVTVETGTESVKGMVVINGDGEKPKNVLMHCIPDLKDQNGKVSLLFRKRVAGAIDTPDREAASRRLRSCFDEVCDLIY